ncbi:MAG: NAD(P)H-dependent oxidoreductase subunit E [Bacteroidales bacterium]|jgi:NADH-quinone oxidoreductase subunit E|nr:NAD(P)H-dependent oxidoreductase subunit E [Bacteroidales bacterium]HOL97662.1 NAD(P)H-dependent oxidoreductase subunit E [Bacteroidales bacterium]HOM37264.1 NAD(P)H-dependent oxidoreductase subunit E [Bacteroidales bacterium]HPD24825.1 NAD(P)H-dependent oxidoreductase subunit E [Bacteroidales bacterium]HRT00330.1 NAD(P)H-dependent oxidoreductase subunit E [Bacteroidales bacterium]
MEEFLNKLPTSVSKTELLRILQEFQDKYGYLDNDFIHELSKKIGIQPGKIFGIASFYSQFRFKPSGKYIVNLCSGVACHINSSENLINEFTKLTGLKDGETSTDGKITLELVPCLGGCANSPVVKVNDKYYIKVTKTDLLKIIQELK